MKQPDQERLKQVLESYGAEATRWPAAEARDLAGHADAASEDLAEARAIDRLLALASVPDVSAAAAERLLARLDGERRAPSAKVVSLQPARRRALSWRWAAALPLAASLAAGLYLGSAGELDSILPGFGGGTVAATTDDGTDPFGLHLITDIRLEPV